MIRRKQTTRIVVHCSATKHDQDIGFEEIDEWHRKRGWDGCGYHQIIRHSGRIEFGRHPDEVGAHAYGYNRTSFGICLVGGLRADGTAGEQFEDTFTEAQKHSLITTLTATRLAYPRAVVLGHRDLSPDIDGDGVIEEWEWLKRCPCFDVRELFTDPDDPQL